MFDILRLLSCSITKDFIVNNQHFSLHLERDWQSAGAQEQVQYALVHLLILHGRQPCPAPAEAARCPSGQSHITRIAVVKSFPCCLLLLTVPASVATLVCQYKSPSTILRASWGIPSG